MRVIKFLLFLGGNHIMKYLKYLLIINHGKITFKDSKGVVISEIKRQSAI